MNLMEELFTALKSKGRGDEIDRVLKRAYESGVSRQDAIAALEELAEQAFQEGNESDENMLVEFADVVKCFCQPKYYIWPPEAK